ncbi:hypothetical protein BASA82_000224 [Batrachochytrium salamandrivorans]|nr:hypothetical protein BASA81_002239 [Batrachochytrium salamandrivorans]KAH9262750.1 hypothetical protein BASA82_000224 [Batrachochytrium salamandrivorans]
MAKRLKPAPVYMVASEEGGELEDLRRNGYCWLKRKLPLPLCAQVGELIRKDLGAKLDQGSSHQQEPVELLEPETGRAMLELQEYFLHHVVGKLDGSTPPHVPAEFSDTLYGRLKRQHFHTAFHSDAFNTIFQRQFLTETHPNVKQFYELGELPPQVSWSDLPIYTFWVCLTKVDSPHTSHLRVLPKSHQDRTAQRTKTNVLPAGFKYRVCEFAGPDFASHSDGGYEVGDVVIFHCLTVHEANAQRTAKPSLERVSLDGRFVWQL